MNHLEILTWIRDEAKEVELIDAMNEIIKRLRNDFDKI